MSVKAALQILDVGLSYHMHHVFGNAGHIEMWRSAYEGKTPDFRMLLDGYSATLDVPACLFWKEIWEQFPSASIVLLYRDTNHLYESIRETVYEAATHASGDDEAQRLINGVFFGGFFEGRFFDREYAIEKISAYYDSVRRGVPSERLLEYQVTDGWEPLCDFLGVPVPDTPFPNHNTRKQFTDRLR